MIVTRTSFAGVLERLRLCKRLSCDTETTGLRAYHGDRLFSLIIATSPSEGFYFNFQAYPGLESELLLLDFHLEALKALFDDPSIYWIFTNAKYDQSILANEGIFVAGTIHCTTDIGRVEYNQHFGDSPYGLASSMARIGLKKDDAVEKYIEEHKLFEHRQIPGKKTKEKILFYNRVPFEIISPYGLTDACGTFAVGDSQEESIIRQSAQCAGEVPPVSNILKNELRLAKTVFRMEQVGVRIDRDYCMRATRFETDRAAKATEAFKRETGRDYANSPKLFAEVLTSEKHKWEFTDKGNPSFKSEIIKYFENPAAKLIMEHRDAKSKADFYNGFLYHADGNGDVHPNFKSGGTAHGRFSGSDPNFQNLTSEDLIVCRACNKGYETIISICEKCGSTDLETAEFHVRRAIIPRPGYVLIMPDYDQVEYRLMFELACRYMGYESAIVKEIKNGKDPHQATADLVSNLGTPLTRSRAKNVNFALLYGSGDGQLAKTIGGTFEDARALRQSVFSIAPELKAFIAAVMAAAECGAKPADRFIFNWLGRKCHFPYRSLSYIAPNHLVAGGAADITKIAMNGIDDYTLNLKSRMIMTVHDELPTEVHESEIATVPRRVKELMEGAFVSQYLPLTCGMEWSEKSLADKRKGFPV